MHELSVTRDILRIVLRYARMHEVSRVHTIMLEIGALSDLEEEWIQNYFDSISGGTVAEGAVIRVTKKPCTFSCGSCGREFPVDLSSTDVVRCPGCGGEDLTFISGTEYTVKSMEAD